MTSAHLPGDGDNEFDDTPDVDPDLNRDEDLDADTGSGDAMDAVGRHSGQGDGRDLDEDGEYTSNDPLNEEPAPPVAGEFTDSDIPGEVDPATAPGRADLIEGEFTDSDIPGEVDPATAPGRADLIEGEYTDADLRGGGLSDKDLPDNAGS